MDTALHKAAKDGDVEAIKECLAEGIEVNQQGAQGRTALHRALGGGFLEACELLMESGADALIADSLKRTSLHWAAMGPPPDNVQCCQLLFDVSEAVAMLTKTTKCALQIRSRQKDSSQPLRPSHCPRGCMHASCLHVCRSGSTPLHSAAVTNRFGVIPLLLEKGADQTIEDDDGFTAYDHARQEGHSEVMALLNPNKGSGSESIVGGGFGSTFVRNGGGKTACCSVQ